MLSSHHHRAHFLSKRKRRSMQQCALVYYLIVVILLALLLHFTVNDALICPLVTYVLVSSYIVLVCTTNSRCCSPKRTYHKPMPKLILVPNSPHLSNNFSDIKHIIIDPHE